ncbi:uncharacterized protein LOC142333722 [Lycorma delicatula]|uniref:uncharacterized protein LOC142333722 n=1 Tax=Lycorma delicatula TaxID=130591 RepID=UPI003F512509
MDKIPSNDNNYISDKQSSVCGDSDRTYFEMEQINIAKDNTRDNIDENSSDETFFDYEETDRYNDKTKINNFDYFQHPHLFNENSKPSLPKFASDSSLASSTASIDLKFGSDNHGVSNISEIPENEICDTVMECSSFNAGSSEINDMNFAIRSLKSIKISKEKPYSRPGSNVTQVKASDGRTLNIKQSEIKKSNKRLMAMREMYIYWINGQRIMERIQVEVIISLIRKEHLKYLNILKNINEGNQCNGIYSINDYHLVLDVCNTASKLLEDYKNQMNVCDEKQKEEMEKLKECINLSSSSIVSSTTDTASETDSKSKLHTLTFNNNNKTTSTTLMDTYDKRTTGNNQNNDHSLVKISENIVTPVHHRLLKSNNNENQFTIRPILKHNSFLKSNSNCKKKSVKFLDSNSIEIDFNVNEYGVSIETDSSVSKACQFGESCNPLGNRSSKPLD